MKHLRNFGSFEKINENIGFGDSNEYKDLIEKYNQLPKEYFNEHFYDLTDDNIVTLRVWKYIGDENGKSVAHTEKDVNISEDHYLYYKVMIEQVDKSMDSNVERISDLKKVGKNINQIIDSLESFGRRIEDDGLHLISTTTNTPKGTIIASKNYGNITLLVKGGKILKEDMEKYFTSWEKTSGLGPKFSEGIKKLLYIYKDYDIDPEIDINTFGEDDTVIVGVLTDYEIFGVATYSKKTGIFKEDMNEIDDSIHTILNTLNG